jgi:hypothetical protein
LCRADTLWREAGYCLRERDEESQKWTAIYWERTNGDDLLVDAKTLAVYYWNHETAKHYDKRGKSDCTKLYNHLVSLLLHVRNQDYVPWDAFQAKEYCALQKGL